jgi:hypothetical protein
MGNIISSKKDNSIEKFTIPDTTQSQTPAPTHSNEPFDYDGVKERITKWCNKLYQDSSYDYKKYQECIKSLDSGIPNNYKRDNEDADDEGKDVTRIYGYYNDARESQDDSNPSVPTVKDDLELFNIYHSKDKVYLVVESDGLVNTSSEVKYREARDWQLINLGNRDETDVYAIRSKYGKFLIGKDNGKIEATSENISSWAQWKIIKKNDLFMFYSLIHKKYMAIRGNEFSLIEGINDDNMWELKEKIIPNGEFLSRTDKSNLNKRKNELTNSMMANYQDALNNKFTREYYENKINKLNYLRDQQKVFLLTLANEKIQVLGLKKNELTNENMETEENIESFNGKTVEDLEILNRQYLGECQMTEECSNATIQLQQPANAFAEAARRARIGQMKNGCKWSDQIVADLVDRKFVPPTEEYCTRLKQQVYELRLMLNGGVTTLHEKIDANLKVIEDIDKELESLETFKNDVTSMYDQIKSNDVIRLNDLVARSESARLASLVKFRQFEKETDDFITEMTKKNKDADDSVIGLIDEIDRKLVENNKLGLSLKTGQSKGEINNYQEIINNNDTVITNQLKIAYRQFYISVFILICIMIAILFMVFKTYNKFV